MNKEIGLIVLGAAIGIGGLVLTGAGTPATKADVYVAPDSTLHANRTCLDMVFENDAQGVPQRIGWALDGTMCVPATITDVKQSCANYRFNTGDAEAACVLGCVGQAVQDHYATQEKLTKK